MGKVKSLQQIYDERRRTEELYEKPEEEKKKKYVPFGKPINIPKGQPIIRPSIEERTAKQMEGGAPKNATMENIKGAFEKLGSAFQGDKGVGERLIDLLHGGLKTAMLPITTPLTATDTALRETGKVGETIAEAGGKIMNLPFEVIKEGQNIVNEGLKKIGTSGEEIDQMLGISPRVSQKGTEFLQELEGLVIFGAGIRGLKGTAQKGMLPKIEVKDATQKGKITESNIEQYQGTPEIGQKTTETSGGNRPIESGQIQEKIANLIEQKEGKNVISVKNITNLQNRGISLEKIINETGISKKDLIDARNPYTPKEFIETNKKPDQIKFPNEGQPGVMTDEGKFITGWDHGDALNRAEDLGYHISGDLGQKAGWIVNGEIYLDKNLSEIKQIINNKKQEVQTVTQEKMQGREEKIVPVTQVIREASKQLGERPSDIYQKAVKIDDKVYDAPKQENHQYAMKKAIADLGEEGYTKAFNEGRISVMNESGQWQKIGGIEQPTFKSWLESQPDVELRQVENLGKTPKGGIIGADTRVKGGKNIVSYADYTPETSFAKEIGRVLANRMPLEELKKFEPELRQLGVTDNLLKDRFASGIKQLTTNPELAEKAPLLTELLKQEKIPLQKIESTAGQIPEFPTTKTERSKISKEFQSPITEKSHFESLKNFTDISDINKYVEEVGKTVEKPRGVITNEMAENLGNMLGLTEKDILKLKKGEGITNVETAAGMQQILTDTLGEMSKTLAEIDFTDIKSRGESTKLADLYMTYQAMQTKFMNAISENARVLQIMKRGLSPREYDTLIGAFEGLKKAGYDITNPSELAKGIGKEMKDPTFGDKALYWWYQSLLSNPLTDAQNIIGNTTYLGSELLTRTLAEPQKTPQVMRGIMRGMKDFQKEAKDIWEGEKIEINKYDLGARQKTRRLYDPSPKNVQNEALKGVAKIGHILLPTNRLKLQDAFFRNVAKNIEKEISVKDLAKKTDNAPDIIRQNFNRIEEILKNSQDFEKGKKYKLLTPEEKLMYDNVLAYDKYARELTFVEPLGKLGETLQNATNMSPFVKWMFPFVRVATNIIKQGLAHTPYYLGKSLAKGEFRDLTIRERTNMVRRALVGTSLFTTLGYLQSQNKMRITGAPSKQLEKEGLKPYHIYMGNTGMPYQSFTPFAPMLATFGSVADELTYNKKIGDQDASVDRTLSILGNTGMGALLDQSAMRSMKTMIEGMANGDATLVAKILTTPIPNFGGFKRELEGDNTVYERKNVIDMLKYKTGIGELKPKRKGGRIVKSQYERFPFTTHTKGEKQWHRN